MLLEKARQLRGDERQVLEYFMKNISVGEILAVKELRVLGVKNPDAIIEKLIEEGFLERGEGCINLSKQLREELKQRRRL